MKELSKENNLFDSVVNILDEARAGVVRATNTNMVIAYWLIGREIVINLQDENERAEYGKEIIKELSVKLNGRYKQGFSVPSLLAFRKFYLVYSDDIILNQKETILINTSDSVLEKEYATRTILETKENRNDLPVFSPHLTWTHYRALMRVDNENARNFYEQETIECGWKTKELERQIHTSYYERIIRNQGESGLTSSKRERLKSEPTELIDVLKSPITLEFLGLPDSPSLHESDLESAIIKNIEAFLLELGKGFSFVARQKQIRYEDDEYYVDLVFYNYILKCFFLIDLKIGKLTPSDVGQMDSYVRLWEDKFKIEGDNPTFGLILCSDKKESVAKYSVLSENKQIFASKYLDLLPSEEELKIEIERERKLLDEHLTIN